MSNPPFSTSDPSLPCEFAPITSADMTTATTAYPPSHPINSGAGPGDWPEDFAHDNGRYLCTCCGCHRQFTGYKRRVVCKVCATADDAKAKERGEWLAEHRAPQDWRILTIDEIRQMHAESSRLMLEANVERNLRRELAARLEALIGCIDSTRGKDAHHALEGGKDALAESKSLDAEIAAKNAKRREGRPHDH